MKNKGLKNVRDWITNLLNILVNEITLKYKKYPTYGQRELNQWGVTYLQIFMTPLQTKWQPLTDFQGI